MEKLFQHQSTNQSNKPVETKTNLPDWLLDVLNFSLWSGIKLANIQKLRWHELIITTVDSKQLIIIEQLDNKEQPFRIKLNNQAADILRRLLKQGYANMNTQFFLSTESRAAFHAYSELLNINNTTLMS